VRLYVPLTPEQLHALRQVAASELRHPSSQAAILVSEGLRRSGALDLSSPDDTLPERTAANESS